MGPIFKTKFRFDHLIALGLVIGLTIFVAEKNRGCSFDDAFITYRYAKNLLEGKGFVYNAGEKHLGTTSPLYALLLAFVGLFNPDIPFWGSFLSLLALGGVAWFTYLLLSKFVDYWAGIVSIPLVLLNRVLIGSVGNESLLLILLLVSQYYFYATGRLKTFAVLAGLGILTRGEGILLPAIIFCFDCARWRRGRKIEIIPWLILIAVIAPWFIFCKSYFGYFLPSTLKVKMLASRNPRYICPATFFEGIVTNFFIRDFNKNFWMNYSINPFSRLVLLIVFFSGLVKSWLDRKFVPLTLSIMAFFAAYSLLRVPRFHWYETQIAYALSLCLSYAVFSLSGLKPATPGLSGSPSGSALAPEGVSAASSPSAREWLPRLRMITLTFLIVILFTAHGIEFGDFRREIYTKTGKWIRNNTYPDAALGMDEIGIVGYYSDRRVLDLWGLATPEMGKGEAQYDFGYLVRNFHPKYVLSQARAPAQALREGMHHPRFYDYLLVKEFSSREAQIGIWKRRDVRVPNLLAREGAVLSASSHHLSSETVEKLCDGDPGTIWHVSPDQVGELSWVMVDFGEGRGKVVRFLVALPRPDKPEQFFRTAELFGSPDEVNWERIAHIIQKRVPSPGEWCSWSFDNDRSFRYYKLAIYDGHESGPVHHFYSLAELALFE